MHARVVISRFIPFLVISSPAQLTHILLQPLPARLPTSPPFCCYWCALLLPPPAAAATAVAAIAIATASCCWMHNAAPATWQPPLPLLMLMHIAALPLKPLNP